MKYTMREMYYTMQIATVVSEMEELYRQKQSPAALELLKESQVVLASTRDLKNRILPSLPCSEEAYSRLISIMVPVSRV
jgi:hypothetical protein